MIPNEDNVKERNSQAGKDENEENNNDFVQVSPVTPKMLIKSLKKLRKNTFRGLYFTPKDVALEIFKRFLNVEQDFQILLMETSDKLICASAAGLIGAKQGSGYYAFDMRQKEALSDTRSELMFWVFYKKLLRRRELENKRIWQQKKKFSEIEINTNNANTKRSFKKC